MSTDNIGVVRGIYEAFQRGDINAVLSSLAPAVTWYSPGGPEIPWAGSRQGREQVGQFFGQLDATLEFLDFAPEQFAASGDTVIGRTRSRPREGDRHRARRALGACHAGARRTGRQLPRNH